MSFQRVSPREDEAVVLTQTYEYTSLQQLDSLCIVYIV